MRPLNLTEHDWNALKLLTKAKFKEYEKYVNKHDVNKDEILEWIKRANLYLKNWNKKVAETFK